ncbi:unnamed protein product, partial [marine sediment metagenome]
DKLSSSLAEKIWGAQQNFENVLENSADAIVICDISGNIVMANRAFFQLLDYTHEEVIGKHIVEFTAFKEGTYHSTTGEEIIIDEEYVSYNASRAAELFEKGYVSNWEAYLVKKDKVHVPTEITMSVLKDKDGERRGSLVIIRDITERQLAEGEIRQQAAFAKNNPAPVVQAEYGGNLIRLNPPAIAIFKKDLTGESLCNVFPEIDKSIIANVKINIPFQLEQEIDEKIFLFTLKKDDSTSSLYIYGIDITERKKAEKEIRETRDFLESIFRNSVDGIIITSPDGHITMANKVAGEIFDYSESELIGK